MVDIYLDNHSTTRLDPRVLEVMLPWLTDRYGNAGSTTHAAGHDAREAVERARRQVAAAIGASPEEVVFTSGATESINIALLGAARRAARTGLPAIRNTGGHRDGTPVPGAHAGGHIISLMTEHRAVLDPLSHLASSGCDVTLLPVTAEGWTSADALAAAMRPDTFLVSVLMANNEIGTILPVSEIASVVRKSGCLFHIDATQSLGKIPFDVDGVQADLASFSAHKLHGPKGCGCLYVRRRGRTCRIDPLLYGGGQERGLRPGTLDVPAIVGFGEAAEIAVASRAEDSTRIGSLRDRLWTSLAERIDGIRLNGPPLSDHGRRLPHNLNVTIPGIDGQTLLAAVAARGLAISAGSACSSTEPTISHVLKAIGLDEDSARCSLRFGLSRFTTREEIDTAVDIVSSAADRLRLNARGDGRVGADAPTSR